MSSHAENSVSSATPMGVGAALAGEPALTDPGFVSWFA